MNNKKLVKIIVTIAFIGATGLFYCLNSGITGKEEIILQKEDVTTTKAPASEKAPKKETTKEEKICVHICGMVKNPGVYELPSTARIADGIKKAGGLKKDAADEAINQARLLKDGEQIYIPSKKEAVAGQTSVVKESSGTESDGKINLNHATKEQLMTLPGIGESKAEKIIAYREKNGQFSKIDEIMKIQGIKQGVFGKIKELITV